MLVSLILFLVLVRSNWRLVHRFVFSLGIGLCFLFGLFSKEVAAPLLAAIPLLFFVLWTKGEKVRVTDLLMTLSVMGVVAIVHTAVLQLIGSGTPGT